MEIVRITLRETFMFGKRGEKTGAKNTLSTVSGTFALAFLTWPKYLVVQGAKNFENRLSRARYLLSDNH